MGTAAKDEMEDDGGAGDRPALVCCWDPENPGKVPTAHVLRKDSWRVKPWSTWSQPFTWHDLFPGPALALLSAGCLALSRSLHI